MNHILRWHLVLALIVGLLGTAGIAPAQASTVKPILVYTGNTPPYTHYFYQDYATFAEAAGRPPAILATWPDNLSAYECVLLPFSRNLFSDKQKADLAGYLRNGGRVLALGTNSGFPETIATLNDLATSLGTGLSLVPDDIDGMYGNQKTTSIDPSPLTTQVEEIYYLGTSQVAIAPGSTGQSLVRTYTGGHTFIAAAPIGDGFFLLSGTPTAFSDVYYEGWVHTILGYEDVIGPFRNGHFAANLCGHAPALTVAQAAVTVMEGQVAANSGTVSDLNIMDNVTLTTSLGTVVNNGDNTWSWSAPTADGPAQSQTVTITADDGASRTAQVSFALNVVNVAPTITGLTLGGQGLTNKPYTVDGAATDPSAVDTTAGFAWQWAVDGGAYSAGANPRSLTFSTCGDHTVSARAQDKDGGLSAPYTATTSIGVYDAQFLAPLNDGMLNNVSSGRVIPVRVSIGCGGLPLTGLAPTIQLLPGDLSPANEVGSAPVEATVTSAADTGGVMQAAQSHYRYHLQVPPTAAAGEKYTIRVRPFGDSNPEASLTAVLLIK